MCVHLYTQDPCAESFGAHETLYKYQITVLLGLLRGMVVEDSAEQTILFKL